MRAVELLHKEISMIYSGGCHCGAVRFEVQAPKNIEVEDCNCSVCRMTGFLHLIVPKSVSFNLFILFIIYP